MMMMRQRDPTHYMEEGQTDGVRYFRKCRRNSDLSRKFILHTLLHIFIFTYCASVIITFMSVIF